MGRRIPGRKRHQFLTCWKLLASIALTKNSLLCVQDWELKNHRNSWLKVPQDTHLWECFPHQFTPQYFNKARTENTDNLALLEVVCPTSGTAFASGDAFRLHDAQHKSPELLMHAEFLLKKLYKQNNLLNLMPADRSVLPE